MAGGLGWTFWLTGGGDEGVRLLETALACPGTAPRPRRAFATMWTSAVMSNAGTGLDRAVEVGEEALALWREVDDEQGRGRGLRAASAGSTSCGATGIGPSSSSTSAHAVLDRYPDHWSQAVATSTAGRAAAFRGDLDTAGPLQQRCVAHFEAAGAIWAVASVNSDIAQLADMRGDIDAAVAANEKALEAARLLRLGLAEAHLLARLGNLALAVDEDDRAERLYERGADGRTPGAAPP